MNTWKLHIITYVLSVWKRESAVARVAKLENEVEFKTPNLIIFYYL